MNDTVNDFLNQKKANSPYIKLAEGESVRITKVVSLEVQKLVNSFQPQLGPVPTLILTAEVDTVDGVKLKSMNITSGKFAEALQMNGVATGSSFVLTRKGAGKDTNYILSMVKNPEKGPSAAPSAPQAAA
jgi:hypothetical protein